MYTSSWFLHMYFARVFAHFASIELLNVANQTVCSPALSILFCGKDTLLFCLRRIAEREMSAKQPYVINSGCR